MIPSLEDTIAAIATPAGEGGVGIARISGKNALAVADKIFRARQKKFSLSEAKPQRFYYGWVVDSEGEVADEVLLVVFKSPHSYTGEDVAEIHGHGGMRSLRAVLELILRSGARMAEPGEFTKRAFLNGRMDLTQAEAVLDTIRAKTDLALKAAMRQLEGALSKAVHSIKDDLMKMAAHMEASLDFPEEDLGIYSSEDFQNGFKTAKEKIETLLASFAKGELVRNGVLVVIVGKPNVGKSSLLNALLERDRAIVSEIPGTTRDVIEEEIEFDGIPIRVADTAGLFLSEEPLTKAGMERTRRYLNEGHLFLWVLDGADGISKDDEAVFSELSAKPVIAVFNKLDLFRREIKPERLKKELSGKFKLSASPCLVSAKTGQGIDGLKKTIVECVGGKKMESESLLLTRLRHKRALEESLEALKNAQAAFLDRASLELVTIDLKRSLDALREMTGEIYTEEILDMIFGEFCIGK